MKHHERPKTGAFHSMQKSYLCSLLFVFLATSALGQTYHFAAHGGGSKKEELLDFKVDGAENSYVLVKYDSNVSFGTDSYTNKAKNSVIAKFDRNGNQLMTKDIPAEGSNALFGALGVSANGMVVAASGTKAGTLDGHEVYNGTFIGKLGSDGSFEWVLQPVHTVDRVRQFLGFRVTAIEVVNNDIYVAATANGKITLNGVTDPGFANDNQQSALLIKLNASGSVQWIRNIPTPEVRNHRTIDGGMDHILPSADGAHIYVAGKVGDGSINPYEVAFVAKFTTDGSFSWVTKTSSSGSDSWGIAETSDGDLISGFEVGGPQQIDFGNGPTLEPSETGWFGALVRLDANGNVKTLKYVTDALHTEATNLGAAKLLTLHHLAVSDNDRVILVGEVVGTHQLKNNLEIASTPGLVGSSPDVAIIVTDLEFDPIEAIANTGSNNEWGRKCVLRSNRIYFSGEYESFSHPFLGSYAPQFGDFTFVSAGDQDVYVASLSTDALPASAPAPSPAPDPTVPALNLSLTRTADTLTLAWPADQTNVILEHASSLAPDSWGALDVTPTLENNHWQVTLPIPSSEIDQSGFYQLRHQE